MVRPWGTLALLDPRLRDVVHDKNLIGMTVYKLGGLGEMSIKNQNVIREFEILEQGNSVVEIVSQHVIVIGLVVQHMPYTLQFGLRGKYFQVRSYTRLGQ